VNNQCLRYWCDEDPRIVTKPRSHCWRPQPFEFGMQISFDYENVKLYKPSVFLSIIMNTLSYSFFRTINLKNTGLIWCNVRGVNKKIFIC